MGELIDLERLRIQRQQIRAGELFLQLARAQFECGNIGHEAVAAEAQRFEELKRDAS